MKSEAFNIDCIEYMKQRRDKQFDLAIVDPPYGVEEMTGKEFAHGRGKLTQRISAAIKYNNFWRRHKK